MVGPSLILPTILIKLEGALHTNVFWHGACRRGVIQTFVRKSRRRNSTFIILTLQNIFNNKKITDHKSFYFEISSQIIDEPLLPITSSYISVILGVLPP